MQFSRTTKRAALATVSLAAVAAAWPTASQAQTAPETSEEIVVTGSRIIRDGYEAPTPLTVVDAASLQQNATANIADSLRTMPVFSGSLNPSQGAGGPSSYQGGMNTLNLRNLGANRTLILIDGHAPSVRARTASSISTTYRSS